MTTFAIIDELLQNELKADELDSVFEQFFTSNYMNLKLLNMQSHGLIKKRKNGKWYVTREGKDIYEEEYYKVIEPIVEREIAKKLKNQ